MAKPFPCLCVCSETILKERNREGAEEAWRKGSRGQQPRKREVTVLRLRRGKQISRAGPRHAGTGK